MSYGQMGFLAGHHSRISLTHARHTAEVECVCVCVCVCECVRERERERGVMCECSAELSHVSI